MLRLSSRRKYFRHVQLTQTSVFPHCPPIASRVALSRRAFAREAKTAFNDVPPPPPDTSGADSLRLFIIGSGIVLGMYIAQLPPNQYDSAEIFAQERKDGQETPDKSSKP
jgi:hypothetical protein